MDFYCNEPKPERRIRATNTTRLAFQHLKDGRFREGLTVIDAAGPPAGNLRADYSWLKGILHMMIGHEEPVLVDRAESYKLAITCFEQAVVCDHLFLLNSSPDLPETR